MSRNDSNLRIDSFNIHRLVIAGVTVGSKYFSDVFFTNSRYAKVKISSYYLCITQSSSAMELSFILVESHQPIDFWSSRFYHVTTKGMVGLGGMGGVVFRANLISFCRLAVFLLLN
jgi:hypothetical protein